jgi:hypothetical protein
MHCSSIVNIHVRAQKGYYLEQACTKCTYKRHIAIKQGVDIHDVGAGKFKNYGLASVPGYNPDKTL